MTIPGKTGHPDTFFQEILDFRLGWANRLRFLQMINLLL